MALRSKTFIGLSFLFLGLNLISLVFWVRLISDDSIPDTLNDFISHNRKKYNIKDYPSYPKDIKGAHKAPQTLMQKEPLQSKGGVGTLAGETIAMYVGGGRTNGVG